MDFILQLSSAVVTEEYNVKTSSVELIGVTEHLTQ